MKLSSFVGNSLIYAAGIGTGLYLCYKAVKLLAKIACDEPKVEKEKRDRVIYYDDSEYEIECGTALFATHRDAEEARDKLQNLIDKYGYATISDLHYLAYFKDFEADDDLGWKDLSASEIMRNKDGYRLRLGKPIKLNT